MILGQTGPTSHSPSSDLGLGGSWTHQLQVQVQALYLEHVPGTCTESII